MDLSSTALMQGSDMPQQYTCEGDDVAPPLCWSDVPDRTRSLALIVDDPDAPDPAAPTMTWVHWVLVDIPPTVAAIPEGGQPLPDGSRDGLNDWHRTGYGGPCLPVGRHRCFFKLYVLDTLLPGLHRPTKADLERAMQGHVLAQAQLVGTYQKHKGRA
jgi:Raf kinase inhibitor-like YbhB/YbcL family protein